MVRVTLSGSDGGLLKRSWLKFCGVCGCASRYWLYWYSMPDGDPKKMALKPVMPAIEGPLGIARACSGASLARSTWI